MDAETRQNEKGQRTGYSSNLYRTMHNDGNNDTLVERQSEDRTRYDSREEQLGDSYNIRNQRWDSLARRPTESMKKYWEGES